MVEQVVKTPDGARTMGVDPSTHIIYMATAELEPPAPGQRRRPQPKPDTFMIVEVGQNRASRGSTHLPLPVLFSGCRLRRRQLAWIDGLKPLRFRCFQQHRRGGDKGDLRARKHVAGG